MPPSERARDGHDRIRRKKEVCKKQGEKTQRSESFFSSLSIDDEKNHRSKNATFTPAFPNVLPQSLCVCSSSVNQSSTIHAKSWEKALKRKPSKRRQKERRRTSVSGRSSRCPFSSSRNPIRANQKNPRHHQNEKTRMDPSMMTMNPESIRAAQAAMAKMSPEQRKPGTI